MLLLLLVLLLCLYDDEWLTCGVGLQYYDDVAVCLRGIILAALAPAYAARNSRQVHPLPAPTPLPSIVWPGCWCSIGRGSGRQPPLLDPSPWLSLRLAPAVA